MPRVGSVKPGKLMAMPRTTQSCRHPAFHSTGGRNQPRRSGSIDAIFQKNPEQEHMWGIKDTAWEQGACAQSRSGLKGGGQKGQLDQVTISVLQHWTEGRMPRAMEVDLLSAEINWGTSSIRLARDTFVRCFLIGAEEFPGHCEWCHPRRWTWAA